ncbi:MAG: universal stress protein [Thermodesulfobacteriota bacterium]
MQFFKRIFFPLDLSETSAKLAPYALSMARKFSAKLHIVFVARMFDHFSEMYVADTMIANFQKAVMEGAKKRLQEFTTEHLASWPHVETTVLAGDIAEEILAYLEANTFDLMILGTHGRKGLEKIFFGSVAERLLKASPAPVLLINPYRLESIRGAGFPDTPFRKIMFPVDLSTISPVIVPFVKAVAGAFGADIELLRVMRSVNYFNSLYVPDNSIFTFEEELRLGAKRKMEEFKQAHFADAPGAKTNVLVGDISECILDFARSKQVDLIVMGTHGRKGLDKIMYGSVAERVAKASPVPVLLVNPHRVSRQA